MYRIEFQRPRGPLRPGNRRRLRYFGVFTRVLYTHNKGTARRVANALRRAGYRASLYYGSRSIR